MRYKVWYAVSPRDVHGYIEAEGLDAEITSVEMKNEATQEEYEKTIRMGYNTPRKLESSSIYMVVEKDDGKDYGADV